ncbi:phage major capsid protein [Caldibacillus debilis]|uniref:phage major capsid protein n=1 Tax=Caldibacillus debilis TaxID=301148 RepID=UPI000E363C31|nr:phage major capsid protein [Caldibacillus debilis]REJ29279.1 MAG: phage major capsid protein [Caldibacillus debilis]
MVLNKGTLFDPVLVSDLFNKVKGESSLAKLSGQEPIPFNGQKEFIFTMENEIDVVAESGKKSHGGVSLEPIIITPIKVEYGARVSNEFMIASEEERINILKAFNDGFARKVARGLDLMAFHGVNPRTGQPTAVIGNNNFDAQVTQSVATDLTDPNDNVEAAIAMIHATDNDVTGMIMSPAFRSALAQQKDAQGLPMFPELAWGNAPTDINGLRVEVNRTVSDMAANNARAYVGDFANYFKWGYSKQIPLKVIEYGDPDNSGNDLQGYNQVYLRAEVFLGWGILDPEAFAIIVEQGAQG